jgi:hypothetical protein
MYVLFPTETGTKVAQPLSSSAARHMDFFIRPSLGKSRFLHTEPQRPRVARLVA